MSEPTPDDAPDETESLLSRADAPILSLREDRLGRETFARALAAEVLSVPATRGYVMGLTGSWGSGKTSVLNMITDAIGDDAIVVHFNPWMFSGTEALVSSFFAEIGKQLGKKEGKFRSIAGKLATYGQVLSPIAALTGAGTAVQVTANALKEYSAAASVFEQHEELRKELNGLAKRLVVIVDDVDRLRPREVRDIVRLVRLVGDFPNTLYLLAFDRSRVEECLGDGNPARGRAYLEKIVQVTHNVPAPRQPDVATLFTDGLVTIVDTLPTGPFDREDWQNIFTFVVRPLLATPRHVQRLLGSLSMTVRMIGDEVAIADLVGVEAVRVLQPELYEAAVSVAEHLFAGPRFAAQRGYQHGRSAADSPIAPMHEAAPTLAAAVCRWLFPAARQFSENTHYGSEWESTWRAQRKLASAAVFRFYLERQLPDGVVPACAVAGVLDHLTDRDELRQLLDQWSSDELMDLLERMNRPIEDLPVDADNIETDPARIATPILLDLLPRLPEDGGGFRPRGTMTLMRVALRLLRRIPDEQARQDAVRAIIADTDTFSSRLILLSVVGHRENIGNSLVSAAVAMELENWLRSELVALSPEDFAAQDRIARLAHFMAETDQGKSTLKTLAENDRVMLRLLVDCVGVTRSQTIGAAAVEETKVLPWDTLIEWFGKEVLQQRIADVITEIVNNSTEISEDETAALRLAADYAAGNRPLTSWERLGQGTSEADTAVGDADPNSDEDTDTADTAAEVTPLSTESLKARSTRESPTTSPPLCSPS